MKMYLLLITFSLFFISSCSLFYDDYDVSVRVESDKLIINANIHNYHGDFIHMSIRKTGYNNLYTSIRSPESTRNTYDWSRVHYWFGELNRDTYLEGRIDSGWGRGPVVSQEFCFEVPTQWGNRTNYTDLNGSAYEYITIGYWYADGNGNHPFFTPGDYEIVIYPWYTGKVNSSHPSSDEHKEVQYIHYENTLASFHFSIE